MIKFETSLSEQCRYVCLVSVPLGLLHDCMVGLDILMAYLIDSGSFRDEGKFRCIHALSSNGSHEH